MVCRRTLVLDETQLRTRSRLGSTRPQTNGKAERFIQTMLREWAYGRLYRTKAERLARLSGWVLDYRTERTHTSLGRITPMEALVNNLRGNHI